MATEVPGNDSASWSNGSAGGNSSALKGATGVRMATEVPGNVSASWRSLGFSFCNGSALELKANGSALGYPTICSFDGVWQRKALAAEVPLTTEVS